ncbi:MAG: oxidoreductase, partial [Jatrophihabitans sp.]
PRNNFPLAAAAGYMFIAGGIGITPLLPMITTVAASGAEWSLSYGGRHRAGMAFLDELAVHGPRVRPWPQDEHGLLDLDGPLATPRPGVLVYCCGPEPLLAAVEQRCATWPTGSLRVERFAAKPQQPVDPTTERDFDAVLARSGRTICVRAGKSVLDALEAEGLAPRNSCREGICGTCETGVLEGVPDHRDSLLSDDERAANDTMMICVGRALSDRLVLDL